MYRRITFTSQKHKVAIKASSRFTLPLEGQWKDFLRLPRKFGHWFGDQLAGHCKLVSPSRCTWFVKVKVENGDIIMLCEGWEKVVADFNLAEGYRVFFDYLGNSMFAFLIYDTSGCECPYSYFVRGSSSNDESIYSKGGTYSASDDCIIIGDADCEPCVGLTILELKERLRAAGLHIRGRKGDLVARLRRYEGGNVLEKDKVQAVGRPRKK